MIAEDDELVRLLLNFTLNQAGYEVIICENGEVAKDKLVTEQIDMLITDINLPHTNGVEQISMVRNKMRLEIPIFVLSAYDAFSVEEEILEKGANRYVSKPFDVKKLMLDIKEVLESAQAY